MVSQQLGCTVAGGWCGTTRAIGVWRIFCPSLLACHRSHVLPLHLEISLLTDDEAVHRCVDSAGSRGRQEYCAGPFPNVMRSDHKGDKSVAQGFIRIRCEAITKATRVWHRPLSEFDTQRSHMLHECGKGLYPNLMHSDHISINACAKGDKSVAQASIQIQCEAIESSMTFAAMIFARLHLTRISSFMLWLQAHHTSCVLWAFTQLGSPSLSVLSPSHTSCALWATLT